MEKLVQFAKNLINQNDVSLAKLKCLNALKAIFLVSILTCGISEGARATPLLDMFKITIFSEFKGVVTNNGKPVEGLVLKRTADHDTDKVYTDTATTDKDGQFRFKRITKWSLRPLMFDTRIHQTITVQTSDGECVVWQTLKLNNFPRGEIALDNEKSSKPIHCRVELNGDDQKDHYINESSNIFKVRAYTGLCELIE